MLDLERRWRFGTLALVLAAHLPSARAAFLHDDHVYLLLLPEMRWIEAAGQGLFGTYFRPLGMLVLWLEARLLPPEPLAHHLVTAALLLGALALVWSCLRRLGAPPWAASAAVLAAGILPPSTIAVAWTSNVFQLLAALLGWGCLLVLLTRRDRASWLAPLLLLGAAAAKEDGLLFLVPYAWLAWGHPRRVRLLAGGAVVTVAVLGVRTLVLGGAGLPPAAWEPQPWWAAAAAAGVVVSVVWFRLRSPLARLALAVGLPQLLAGLLAWDATIPWVLRLDIRLRFLFLAGLAVAPAAALLLARLPRPARGAVAALLLAAAAAGHVATVTAWKRTTARAEGQAEAVVAALRERPSRIVIVDAPLTDVALDASVKRRLPPAARPGVVVVQPDGILLMTVGAELWREIGPRLPPLVFAGNPATVGGWVVALVEAPELLWNPAIDPLLADALEVRLTPTP